MYPTLPPQRITSRRTLHLRTRTRRIHQLQKGRVCRADELHTGIDMRIVHLLRAQLSTSNWRPLIQRDFSATVEKCPCCR